MGFETVEPSVAWKKSFNRNTFIVSQLWVLGCNSNIFSSYHRVNRYQRKFCSHTLQSLPSFLSLYSLFLDMFQLYQHNCVGLSQVLSHSLSLRISWTLQCLISHMHCKIVHFSQHSKKNCITSLFSYNHIYLLTSTFNSFTTFYLLKWSK